MTYGTCILPLLINLVNHLEIFSKVKRDKIYNLCFCHNEKLKCNSYEMSLSYYEKCNEGWGRELISLGIQVFSLKCGQSPLQCI